MPTSYSAVPSLNLPHKSFHVPNWEQTSQEKQTEVEEEAWDNDRADAN
jgi:hypothetical protein